MVCGREGERRGKERRGGRREGMNLSLSTTPHQLPCGAYTLRGYTLQPLSKHTTTQPLSIEPRPKNGGSPPPPHQGKGRTATAQSALSTHTILYFFFFFSSSPPGERAVKEEEKGTFYTYYPLFFSLGENPQTPPSNWDAQEKDKKSEGAR